MADLLYTELAQKLREGIFASVANDSAIKEYKLPPERELMKQMGVSSSTIRLAIKELVKQGLVVSRHGSGTYASQDIINGQRTIGVIFGVMNDDMMKSPFHLHLYHRICQQIEDAGWLVRVYTLFHGTEQRDERMYNNLIADGDNRKFCGVISMVANNYLDKRIFDVFDEHQIAQLNFDCDAPHSAVMLDYFALGRLGAEYFHKIGIRKIGIIGAAKMVNGAPSDDCAGFLRGLQSYPEMTTCDEWICNGVSRMTYGYQAFKQIWSATEKPEGIVVSDDIVFIGVMIAMLQLGVRYPEDLKLVVQGTVEAKELNVFMPPRLMFSVADVASLAVNQIVDRVQKKIFGASNIRVSPKLMEHAITANAGQDIQGTQVHILASDLKP